MINREQFQDLFSEVKNDLLSLKIPISENINSNIRYTRNFKVLGTCEKISGFSCGFMLSFSELIFYFPTQIIKDVIAHELIHTCNGCFDHRAMFKNYANRINKIKGYNVNRTLDRDETINYLPEDIKSKYSLSSKPKYFVECKRCGDVIGRCKMSNLIKFPEQYRCAACGGHFKRIL